LSLLNRSKDMPVPGSTMTPGPLGMLAQPLIASMTVPERAMVKRDIKILLP
jgi:hypothetical protein